MDINKISKKIESKRLSETSIRDVKIIDNNFKHLKNSYQKKGKFHIKLEINSDLLKNKNRVESNKVIYKILSEELKTEIHSLQISFI